MNACSSGAFLTSPFLTYQNTHFLRLKGSATVTLIFRLVRLAGEVYVKDHISNKVEGNWIMTRVLISARTSGNLISK